MSQQTRTFNESVAQAAECYVEQCGSIEAAIDELVERRKTERLGGRIEEAIAYLRYTGDDEDGT